MLIRTEQLQRNALTYTTTIKQNEKHDRFRPLVFVWCQKRERKQPKKKKEKKKIDKKLKQSNFQNLHQECILSLQMLLISNCKSLWDPVRKCAEVIIMVSFAKNSQTGRELQQ